MEDSKDMGKDKLREYGKEGLAPLMELFNRYGKDIVHYMKHVETGLERGCEALRSDKEREGKGQEGAQSESEERQMVASWFEEGAKWVGKLEEQLENKNSDELLEFVERQGREHPAALFATSLVAGSMVGVIGREAFQARGSEVKSESISGNI